MQYELHHGGNSHNNFANLQVAHAIKNCKYYEFLLPDAAQNFGLLRDVAIDKDGFVAASEEPGVGALIDFELIKKKMVTSL